MFFDAFRYQHKAKRNVSRFGWMLALVLDPFPKEADMQNMTAVLQFYIMCMIFGIPTNYLKSELKTVIPKKIPKIVSMAPLGLHFGTLVGTFGGQFCMLLLGSKMGTLGECGYQGK